MARRQHLHYDDSTDGSRSNLRQIETPADHHNVHAEAENAEDGNTAGDIQGIANGGDPVRVRLKKATSTSASIKTTVSCDGALNCFLPEAPGCAKDVLKLSPLLNLFT